jgi:Na+/proline symporter
MIFTGRLSSLVFVILSVAVAASPGNIDQAFQFIQEYTGMVSPGITAIFILGMFWKKTTAHILAGLWMHGVINDEGVWQEGLPEASRLVFKKAGQFRVCPIISAP